MSSQNERLDSQQRTELHAS